MNPASILYAKLLTFMNKTVRFPVYKIIELTTAKICGIIPLSSSWFTSEDAKPLSGIDSFTPLLTSYTYKSCKSLKHLLQGS